MVIIQNYCHRLGELAKNEESIRNSYAIAEATEQHNEKAKAETKLPL